MILDYVVPYTTCLIRLLRPARSDVESGPLRRIVQYDNLDGEVWMELFESADGYLIRFANLVDFAITQNEGDTSSPIREIPDHTIEHLLFDHVLPRVIAHEGRTVLHAAAIEINGRIIAFLGDTGWGKSTLTASLWRSGSVLVSDDCVVIADDGDPIMAVGIYPGMRLWPDSADAVGTDSDEIAPMAHYSSKRRIAVDAGQADVQTTRRPLQQVYLLGTPDENEFDITVTEIPPNERVIHLLEHSFRLDPTDRARNSAEFERLTALAERLPMFRLQYPRRYELLPDVRAALLAHVSATP